MMNEPLREEIKREEHRVPRSRLAFVVSLALASVVMAVRLNYDFVRTLGFLAASCIFIFMLSVVAYFALDGLSVLLEGLDLSQDPLQRQQAPGRHGRLHSLTVASGHGADWAQRLDYTHLPHLPTF